MRAALPHTEGRTDRDGVGVHYEVYGEGERTILFIPTWSIVHSRVYKAQIPWFSDHFRVVTYDPRGNGRSDRPDTADGYTLDQSVGDALAVLDSVGAARAALFGFSYSSLVAAFIAATHPDRVDAVVSVGANVPFVPPHPHRSLDRFEATHASHDGWRKFNRRYWRSDYEDFCQFFMERIFPEKHSTKQIEDGVAWARGGDGEMLAMTLDARFESAVQPTEDAFRGIVCPLLAFHGDADGVAPLAMSEKLVELTKGELRVVPGGGHAAHCRFPAMVNVETRDFLARRLGWGRKARSSRRAPAEKRALYLSSPIGLGHARRDMAIARELRAIQPNLKIDWLAQDPVTRLLGHAGERVHPLSARTASESAHIEGESAAHELHAFNAIREMDEILAKNFMVFQEAVEEGGYDLVIGDEAWDIDHFLHEHPHLKRAALVWMTDFVGFSPMAAGGGRERFLTADYNSEMIDHVEGAPQVRDRAIFVGLPEDVSPISFGPGLPDAPDWTRRHFDFADYVLGAHPDGFGARAALRRAFGFGDDETVCIVAVGGSGVGGALIRRILDAYPAAKRRIANLRMIVVVGPRLDPARFRAPAGVEMAAFLPDLDRRFAASDLALVQGGLTTCMELAAARIPFLYFPLKNHFEQNVHVAHRLDRYGAGRRMTFAESDPDRIAAAMVEELRAPRIPSPVAADGAGRAARMIAELL